MAAIFNPNSLNGAARTLAAAHPSADASALTALLRALPQWAGASYRSAHNACRAARQSSPAAAAPAAVEVEAKPGEPWTVEQGHYAWNTGKGQRFCLSVELVDELFYNFSKHGLNLTQTQVINKFNLQTWQWNSLKSRLGLVKLANVFSPHTEQVTPKAELSAMMEAKMNARFENRGLIIEQAYQQSTAKQYLKVIEQAADHGYLNQKVLAELADRFPAARVRYLLKTPPRPGAPKVQKVTLADTHAGAKVAGMLRSFQIDREQLFDYAQQLCDEVNAVGAEQNWLFGLGDYIETLTGLNHPNSWKGADTFGADSIALAVELWEFFIGRIHNLVGILAVGGNHDRITSNKKEDTGSEVANAVFYILRRLYGHVLDIEYHPKLVCRQIDGITYILKHGYTGDVSSEKNATDLIADFQTKGVFTVLVTADKHTRGVFLDGNRKRWLRCPSLFTGNEYSEDLGFTSLAGAYLITAHRGFPRVLDVPLIPLAKNNTFNPHASVTRA
jgi:hypothetical protein